MPVAAYGLERPVAALDSAVVPLLLHLVKPFAPGASLGFADAVFILIRRHPGPLVLVVICLGGEPLVAAHGRSTMEVLLWLLWRLRLAHFLRRRH